MIYGDSFEFVLFLNGSINSVDAWISSFLFPRNKFEKFFGSLIELFGKFYCFEERGMIVAFVPPGV